MAAMSLLSLCCVPTPTPQRPPSPSTLDLSSGVELIVFAVGSGPGGRLHSIGTFGHPSVVTDLCRDVVHNQVEAGLSRTHGMRVIRAGQVTKQLIISGYYIAHCLKHTTPTDSYRLVFSSAGVWMLASHVTSTLTTTNLRGQRAEAVLHGHFHAAPPSSTSMEGRLRAWRTLGYQISLLGQDLRDHSHRLLGVLLAPWETLEADKIARCR